MRHPLTSLFPSEEHGPETETSANSLHGGQDLDFSLHPSAVITHRAKNLNSKRALSFVITSISFITCIQFSHIYAYQSPALSKKTYCTSLVESLLGKQLLLLFSLSHTSGEDQVFPGRDTEEILLQ
ncbi:hypothetical protein I308_101665 [Cryptococcus tetragattii IND107]|uniref:Uncharacterized protein n=1 Tax=Cryptococcus tetragattii IND107 TaxID=1296105 RepID=A0ABR3BXK7_9TREE